MLSEVLLTECQYTVIDGSSHVQTSPMPLNKATQARLNGIVRCSNAVPKRMLSCFSQPQKYQQRHIHDGNNQPN